MIYDKGVDIVSGENIEYEDYAVKTRSGDVLIPSYLNMMHYLLV